MALQRTSQPAPKLDGKESQDEPLGEIGLKPKSVATAKAAPAFLDLPPELRNMVYCYLLVSEKSVHDQSGTTQKTGLDSRTHNGLHPAILRTCKTISCQASPILYGRNEFDLMKFDLQHFPRSCGLVNTQNIRHLNAEHIIIATWQDNLWTSPSGVELLKELQHHFKGVTKIGGLKVYKHFGSYDDSQIKVRATISEVLQVFPQGWNAFRTDLHTSSVFAHICGSIVFAAGSEKLSDDYHEIKPESRPTTSDFHTSNIKCQF